MGLEFGTRCTPAEADGDDKVGTSEEVDNFGLAIPQPLVYTESTEEKVHIDRIVTSPWSDTLGQLPGLEHAPHDAKGQTLSELAGPGEEAPARHGGFGAQQISDCPGFVNEGGPIVTQRLKRWTIQVDVS